jgi:hypothetical protein
LGISFQYPDNWTLDDADALLGRQSVTVLSPGGAFWSVAIHSGSSDPEKMASAILDAMRQEYESLEIEEAAETVAGFELTGYDLAFYCLDLTNTASIRSVRTREAVCTIYCQAEDREYEQIKRVFEAITVSLLVGLGRL